MKHLFSVSLIAAAGCATGCAPIGTWVRAHGDGKAWLRAASPLNPQHIGSLALLASVPYFAENDRRLSRHLARNRPVGGKDGEHNGDVAAGVLAGSPLVASGISALFPDHDAEALEVLEIGVESLLLTAAVTETLKVTVRRDRPNNNSGRGGRLKPSDESFPSSHVSLAMAGSAVTGRWLRSRSPWLIFVELGLYAGVAYTAITRIENDKHFPTDVVAGAIFGGYFANTIWDAHYGRKGKPGIFDRIREHVVPVPVEDGVAILITVPF